LKICETDSSRTR